MGRESYYRKDYRKLLRRLKAIRSQQRMLEALEIGQRYASEDPSIHNMIKVLEDRVPEQLERLRRCRGE